MIYELEIYIRDEFSPEMQSLLNRSFYIFNEYEIEGIEDKYVNLILDYDNQDPISVRDNFLNEILLELKAIAKTQGVEINDYAQLEYSLIIVESLLNLQSYTDVESIIRIIETDYDDREKLIVIFSLVSYFQEIKMLESIDLVNSNIFKLILQFFKDKIATEEYDNQNFIVSQNQIREIKMFFNFIKDENLYALALINDGFKIGLPFKNYYNILQNKLKDVSNETLSKELACILLLSSDSYNSPLMYFKNNSTQIINGLDLITKIDYLLSKIFFDFDRFKKNEAVV